MPTPEASPVRPSATLILLRDGAKGVEVHLSRRNPSLRFMGGAWVFPGGSVDVEDARSASPGAIEGFDQWYGASPLRGELASGEAHAFLMAALRETVEEVAVFLGDGAPEDRAGLRDAALGGTLGKALGELGLRFSPRGILPWGRWVTPKAFPRRFDTLFFVAPCPEGQEPVVDGGELVEGRWFAPEAALAAHLEGGLPLAPPTLVALQELSTIGSVSQLPEAAQGRQLGPACPHALVMTPGSRVLVMPGDKAHPEVPGPGLRRAVEIRPWVFRVEVS